jgi:hypothetical protein
MAGDLIAEQCNAQANVTRRLGDRDRAIQALALIATPALGVRLSTRHTASATGLIHLVHQQLGVVGWEILG